MAEKKYKKNQPFDSSICAKYIITLYVYGFMIMTKRSIYDWKLFIYFCISKKKKKTVFGAEYSEYCMHEHQQITKDESWLLLHC